MARTGVNYFDIVQAADTIKQRGEEPTVDRVREELGTGSKSTIAPLLKRWKAETGNAQSEIGGLPKDLVDALKGLQQRIQDDADRRIDTVREESEEALELVRAELVEARVVLAERSASLQELEQKLGSSEESNRELHKSLDESRAALAKSEFQREEAGVRIAELRNSVDELKQENRTVREHFEFFQQRIADDRQQERDQFRQSTAQLNGQIAHLNEQLSVAGRRLDEREQQFAELGSRSAAQASELQLAQQALTAERAELDSMRQHHNAQAIKLQESAAEIAQLRDQVAGLSSSNAACTRDSELQRQACSKLEIEIKRLRENLTSLRMEHQQALQEKAELKGQLVQLERAVQTQDTALQP
ncbi:DNA-binding protein [Microbulbifer sp. ALW1]|uniref:DNA-binding protein n=1 Tax=Microbulbifer sp. (strain ALW1) TaxID=1516059 RepID=UPI0013598DCD|nr:DNA-binding protein [Microbulbifer sp. ALW1]